MFFQRLKEDVISVAFGLLEAQAPRVEEGGDGGDKEKKPPVALKPLEEVVAVADGLRHRLRRLLGQPNHIEDVHPPAAGIQRLGNRPLQVLVGIVAPRGFADYRVVGFGGNLQAKVGAGAAHPLEKAGRGGVEQLQNELVFDPLQPAQYRLGVVPPRLEQVAQDKDRPRAEFFDLLHAPNHVFRGAKDGPFPPVALAEGGGGAAADNAVFLTALAGKHGGDGVVLPALEGGIAGQVAVSYHRAHGIGVVADHKMAQVGGDVGEGVFPHPALCVPPNKIRHFVRLEAVLDAVHKLAQRFLGGIAPHHIVDLGVLD